MSLATSTLDGATGRVGADSHGGGAGPARRPAAVFLSLLESAGVLGTAHRELIIERAMALADFNITLNRLKVIVLMVLWQQEEPIDTLMVDELLAEEDDWALHEPTVH